VNFADALNGKGSDTEVYFNPKADPDIMTVDPATGNVSAAKRPAFIGLAHELIHAERSMRGEAIDYGITADYTYQISKRRIDAGRDLEIRTHTQHVPKEELATVGLAYNKNGDITENMIRAEHNLRPRGAY